MWLPSCFKPRNHPRGVVAASSGGRWQTTCQRARSRRAQHGGFPAPSKIRGASFRSLFAVSAHRVREAMRRSGHHDVDGLTRRLLRQRDVRKLQRNARSASCSFTIDSKRNPMRRFRSSTSSNAVQSAPPTFGLAYLSSKTSRGE